VVRDDFFLYGGGNIEVDVKSFEVFVFSIFVITFSFVFVELDGLEEVEERFSINSLGDGSGLSGLLIFFASFGWSSW